MSGSRGEANFVWKCKNCKVFTPIQPMRSLVFNQTTSSESLLLRSRQLLSRMSKPKHPRPRRLSNLTAEDLSLLSLTRR